MNIDPNILSRLEEIATMHFRAWDQVEALANNYEHDKDEELVILHSTDEYTDENPWHGQMRDFFQPADDREPIFMVVGPEGDTTRLGFLLQRSAVGRRRHYIDGMVTLEGPR